MHKNRDTQGAEEVFECNLGIAIVYFLSVVSLKIINIFSKLYSTFKILMIFKEGKYVSQSTNNVIQK